MKTVILTLTLTLTLTAATATTAHAADLNKDDAATIARDCKGIGPAIATRIIEAREKDGPFPNYADLQKRVRGIGEKKRADIEQQETCNVQPQAQPKN